MERELKKLVGVYAAVEQIGADPVPAADRHLPGRDSRNARTLDPHSVFFDPDQFEQLQQMQSSERKGFGTVVSLLPGRLIVLQTLEGSPSAKAGLSAGDEILAINTIPVRYLDIDQLTQLLGEARQKEATLDVRKPGSERPMQMVMSPALLDAPTVDRAYMVAPGIGTCASPLRGTHRAAGQADDREAGRRVSEGLIIDLRDNPGGAVQISGRNRRAVLSPGQLIFNIEGRSTKPERVAVPDGDALLVSGCDPGQPARAPALPRSSPARCRITTAPSCWASRASAEGSGPAGLLAVGVQQVHSAHYGVLLHAQRPIHPSLFQAANWARRRWCQGPFRSDSGRSCPAAEASNRMRSSTPLRVAVQQVLDASGALTSFAGDYLRTHTVADDGQVTSAMLDELKVFLSERSIQPSVADWLTYRAWIANRLQQEILTLKFGVARGDEIELQRDAVIQTALKKLRGAP
jgi:carboxyl-terminal processing protease